MKLKRQKREEAQKRAQERSKRSDKEQLRQITEAGHGHSREAKRLTELTTKVEVKAVSKK
jgi:hypothetical protein